MKNIFIYGIIILIIIFSIYLYIRPIQVKSEINGEYYLVKNVENKQEVSNKFSVLDNNIKKLLTEINNDKKSIYYKNSERLIERWNKDILYENIFNYGTSFTVNKGEYLFMCMSNDNTNNTNNNKNQIYDDNTLMFVLIHELAHIGSVSHGHTNEFILFFRYLLQKCINIGTYKYVNYSSSPVEYCGIKISETPL